MKEKNKLNYKKAIIIFLGYSWKIILALSGIVSLLGAFTNFEYTKEHPFQISFIMICTTIIVSLLLLVKFLIERGVSENEPLDLAPELVTLVKRLYEEDKFLDVVRFGSTASRYLHLNGNLNERIEIGRLVEDAASKEGRIAEQVSALIDDLGWSKSIEGDYETAKLNISNGIALAVENKMYYFAAKGERHLSGIEKHSKNIPEFLTHMKNAEAYTSQIIDLSDKNEMEASLHLAKAKYSLETNELEEAERSAKKAMELFKNDTDRQVKIHALLGNIYLKRNNLQKAKDEFNKGYLNCKDVRKDEYAKNAVGLAKLALKENDFKNGKKYLVEAKNIGKDSLKSHELQEIETLLKSIKV